MNKVIALVVGAVIVVGGGVALVVSRGKDDNTAKITNSANGQSQEVKIGDSAIVQVDACDVLTETVAKKILGDAAVKGDTQAGSASSNEVSVSNCVYYVRPAGATAAQIINDTKGVSILVRAAKTQTGAAANKTIFSATPAGAQNVTGIGDKAYFKSDLGQLSVLKGGNYYIVSNYHGKATSGTLESDTQLARLLSFK